MRLGQFCENFENTRENLSLILLGLMRLHILIACTKDFFNRIYDLNKVITSLFSSCNPIFKAVLTRHFGRLIATPTLKSSVWTGRLLLTLAAVIDRLMRLIMEYRLSQISVDVTFDRTQVRILILDVSERVESIINNT